MSLQVWLPLNGNLKNQGLQKINFINGGATINDNGKIGKCYGFNGNSNFIYADFTPGTIVPNEMSFCCWAKFNSFGSNNTGSTTLFCSRKIVGSGMSIFIMRDGVDGARQLRFDNGNDKNVAGNQTTFDYIFSENQWYHIAIVQTSTQKKLYINGELQQSINKASANQGANTATKCFIGGSTSNDTVAGVTSNFLNGYLNDVRIYDHALSPKEVKEISKGLVLHLKLNNNNKIYDCSGYKNNGIIIKSLTLDNTSPRYDNAIHFSATNQKIQISNLNVAGFSDSYTFSWWGKVPNYSNKMMWGFSNGVRLNGICNGNLWNTGDSTDNPIYEPGTTTQVTAPTGNKWYHYVMVGNGSNNTCKVYINGELFGQAKTYKTISGTEIFINGWLSNTKYSYNNMSISDFRLYATALDDNEIKKLYNISGAIDNDGNLYIRELVE